MSHIFIHQSPYRQHYFPTNSAAFRRRSGVDALKLKFEFGPLVIIVGLLLVSLFMGFLYLAHFNQVATKGYELRRLEADRQQLLSQYDLSDMRLADVKNLDAISRSDKVFHMRPVAYVTFVSGNTALASADRL